MQLIGSFYEYRYLVQDMVRDSREYTREYTEVRLSFHTGGMVDGPWKVVIKLAL